MGIRERLDRIAAERILILDGAMGTMIQKLKLKEEDFRGEAFTSHPVPLLGCNDLLCLTKPDAIRAIHGAYLDAGADIIESCSFNANAISLADYGLENYAYEISRAAASLAKETALRYSTAEKPRFVAGILGPTTKSASISPDMDDPGKRGTSWDELMAAYYDNARGLLDGGADILMVETVFDTLNAKAALFAVERILEERGMDVPLMVSATIADAAGRLLSGQTLEAFCVSVLHAKPWSLGLNCSLGAETIKPYAARLSEFASALVSCHPNAGMPNRFGEYDEDPATMAGYMGELMEAGFLNIAGGCCGTTPEHIAVLAGEAARHGPRRLPPAERKTRLAGLEALLVDREKGLTKIGERTNVAGSRKFLRLIKEKKHHDALSIARDMIARGADLIDICMDDALLDAGTELVNFINLALSDPDIARLPLMIDSSRWEAIEGALKCVQGKSLVNSISLKEGEGEFLRKARLARRYGAAVVVMLFDEEGQAAGFERKVEVARRSYRLLTEDGFPPEDIVFDPNVLAVATGIAEHDPYALDFIRACAAIRDHCPGVQISGGVSNLSFSFRGNETVREAMHAVFLKHAFEAGLSMAIINPAANLSYDRVDEKLKTAVEDLILCREAAAPGARAESPAESAAERLLNMAMHIKEAEETSGVSGRGPAGSAGGSGAGNSGDDSAVSWREKSAEERLIYALVRGIDDFVEADVGELRGRVPSSLAIVEGPLMDGMKEVGRLFGEGRMFLPQLIRSARVMKRAVAVLEPYIEAEKQAAGGSPAGRSGPETATSGAPGPAAEETVVMATVKGDVHDIGKNIVSVVLGCNGYRILDLGVMIPSPDILDAAEKAGAKAIGLSGLITPSLEEMIRTAGEMEARGFTIPLLIGGATTSLVHTALRIAPEYSGPVVYVPDAGRSAETVRALLSETERPRFLEDLDRQYREAAERHEKILEQSSPIPLEEARRNKVPLHWAGAPNTAGGAAAEEPLPGEPAEGRLIEFQDYPAERVIPYINWDAFLHGWDMGRAASGAREGLLEDAREILDRVVSERLLKLRGVIGFFPARSEGDDLVLDSGAGSGNPRFAFLRNQEKKRSGAPNPCLADFIAPEEYRPGAGAAGWLGLFALSAGFGLEEEAGKYRDAGDDYRALLLSSLADRLTEAFSEEIHLRVRREFWAYAPEEKLSPAEVLRGRYRGIRPGFGYPACPDHHDKETAFTLLEARERCGLELTSSAMIIPASSVCGMYLAHPAAYYFGVGRIGEDQLADWAARKGISLDEAQKRTGMV